ncbi:hypothetical protein MMC30_001437 [Trapelia coarctata]|nr:hypothetical protein [Trapelia coarctata]
MPSLESLPAETRREIFSYLRQRPYPIRLGHNPDHHARTRQQVPPLTGAKTFPVMNDFTSIIRVCRLFEKEPTPEIYRRLTFSVENTTASIEAGFCFILNLRPATLEFISRFLIFHQVLLSNEPGFDLACDIFCETARRMAFKKVIITVGCLLGGNLWQWSPFMDIHNVGQTVVRLGAPWNNQTDELHNVLDVLNAIDITATAPGYAHRPGHIALQTM